MRGLLTRSILLYLLRHNRKDLEDFDHYLYHDALHRICHLHLGVFLEPFEKALDFVEDHDELIVAHTKTLRRLYGFRIRSHRAKEIQDDSYRKEDTGASENDIRGREYLELRYQTLGRKEGHLNGIYQPNACANYRGGRSEDVDDRVQPFYQFVIGIQSFLNLRGLRTKELENFSGIVAGLQLGHQRMRDKACVGLPLILLQRILKDGL